MDAVRRRWWRAQLPVMRAGMIFLRSLDGEEPQNGVHQVDVVLDLAQRCDVRAILEQHVVGATLLRDRIRELTHAPLEDLADRSLLILDERLDTRRDVFRARLTLI